MAQWLEHWTFDQEVVGSNPVGVDSLAQWLEHWTFDQEVVGSNPVGVESFSAMPYFSSLRFFCRKK